MLKLKILILSVQIVFVDQLLFGQNTWNSVNTGTTTSLFSLSFPTKQTGWVVGQEGLIMKTTDGGNVGFPFLVQFKNRIYYSYFNNFLFQEGLCGAKA